MTDPTALSVAFLNKRPVAAARILAAIDAMDAAAFISGISSAHAAHVLAHTSAWSAAAILSHADAGVSGEVLKVSRYVDATAVLRLMTPAARARALTAVPEKLRRDFAVALAFPDDTVGAHMTTSILIQRAFHTVADARSQVRRAPAEDVPVVFVVDEAHQIEGLVGADALLRHDDDTSLQEVMQTGIQPLSARARIASVFETVARSGLASLPVVSRRKAVIGALSRGTAARWRRERDQHGAPPDASLTLTLGAALSATAGGLLRLAKPGELSLPPGHRDKGEGE